jgi:hypothetical protein
MVVVFVVYCVDTTCAGSGRCGLAVFMQTADATLIFHFVAMVVPMEYPMITDCVFSSYRTPNPQLSFYVPQSISNLLLEFYFISFKTEPSALLWRVSSHTYTYTYTYTYALVIPGIICAHRGHLELLRIPHQFPHTCELCVVCYCS